MKKFFIFLVSSILCGLMLFSFVACKDGGNEANHSPKEEQSQEEQLPETGSFPNPKNPESLSEEKIAKIKQAYYDKLDGGKLGATIDNVYVSRYCGTYSGYVVIDVGFNGDCSSGFGGDPKFYLEYEVGDVVFYNYSPLTVWKENGEGQQSTFYRLEEAYKSGLISYNDLKSIAYHYNNKNT